MNNERNTGIFTALVTQPLLKDKKKYFLFLVSKNKGTPQHVLRKHISVVQFMMWCI
jgi:hypothetical protein